MELRIQKLINLAGWKSMPVTNPRDFVKVSECPCCTSPLSVLAVLANDANTDCIRIGCCDACGFVTMMDKPSHQWIIDFYASTWRNEEDNATTLKKLSSSRSKLLPVLQELAIAKSERILEIGTGRGGNFAALKKEGYTNLFGIENSKHRGEQVASALDVSIFIGGYEQDHVQRSVQAHAPYKIIYTSHVVEHVYDPEQTIDLSASLQNEGDYLIIAVPNFVGEPALGVLAFLPHLHSFTKDALAAILSRKGYRTIDETKTTREEVFLVARKGGEMIQPALGKKRFLDEAMRKLETELRLRDMPSDKPVYYVFSRKKSEETSIEKRSKWAAPIMDAFYKIKCKRSNTRAIVALKKPTDKSALMLSFPEAIHLFYK